MMSDDDIEKMKEEIEAEKKAGDIMEPEQQDQQQGEQ